MQVLFCVVGQGRDEALQGNCAADQCMDFWVLIWKGIQFHYLASWAGCRFGLEAFKRVWRLVMSCLNVWHNLMFFKRNLSNIMELFHDVSFNNCCLQNEMKQGLFLQQCREINYFVLINRGRVWRSQQHSPPPKLPLRLYPLWAVSP